MSIPASAFSTHDAFSSSFPNWSCSDSPPSSTPSPQVILHTCPPSRTVFCMDTTEWLQQQTMLCGSVVTSIPDFSEINMDVEPYKKWFVDTASSIMSKLPRDTPQVAIFYQTDCKIENANGDIEEWLDKSFLLQQAASQTGCRLLFRKIALIKAVEGLAKRPSFSHVLCFTPHSSFTYKRGQVNFYPDVSNRGDVLWAKGMGTQATLMAVRFVRDVVKSGVVFDPFCGRGTVLAAANFLGLNAVGVELSSVRCAKSRKLQWESLFGDEGTFKMPCEEKSVI